MTVTTDKKTEPEDKRRTATTRTALPLRDSTSIKRTDDRRCRRRESVDAEADSDAGESTRRRWPRRVLVGALALIFVASLAASGILGWNVWQQRQVTRAGQQAQQAAVKYARDLDQHRLQQGRRELQPGARRRHRRVQGHVLAVQHAAAPVAHRQQGDGPRGGRRVGRSSRRSKSKVVVLLFVDQSVSNTSVPDPRIDRSRIKMTMEYVDGRWRTSKVELR